MCVCLWLLVCIHCLSNVARKSFLTQTTVRVTAYRQASRLEIRWLFHFCKPGKRFVRSRPNTLRNNRIGHSSLSIGRVVHSSTVNCHQTCWFAAVCNTRTAVSLSSRHILFNNSYSVGVSFWYSHMGCRFTYLITSCKRCLLGNEQYLVVWRE